LPGELSTVLSVLVLQAKIVQGAPGAHTLMLTRTNIEITNCIGALISALEAECERAPDKFEGSAEERLLFALKTARDSYLRDVSQ
jgi:hypothetical protein